MTDTERRFARRAVRRKRLFLVLAVAGVVVAATLSAYYGIRRWRDPAFPLGPRFVLVLLILLNSRQNLRQHRFARLLEELAPPDRDGVADGH